KYKNIKKVVKIALWVVFGIVVLMTVLVLSLQLRPVQNFIAHKASDYLSKELQTTIQLESIYFQPFNSIQIKKFYIEDRDQDTLLFVDEFLADLDFRSIWNNKLTVNGIEISRGKVSIKKKLD